MVDAYAAIAGARSFHPADADVATVARNVLRQGGIVSQPGEIPPRQDGRLTKSGEDAYIGRLWKADPFSYCEISGISVAL